MKVGWRPGKAFVGWKSEEAFEVESQKTLLYEEKIQEQTYLFESLELGMILTHSRFWNDASNHSVLVKVNWKIKEKIVRQALNYGILHLVLHLSKTKTEDQLMINALQKQVLGVKKTVAKCPWDSLNDTLTGDRWTPLKQTLSICSSFVLSIIHQNLISSGHRHRYVGFFSSFNLVASQDYFLLCPVFLETKPCHISCFETTVKKLGWFDPVRRRKSRPWNPEDTHYCKMHISLKFCWGPQKVVFRVTQLRYITTLEILG